MFCFLIIFIVYLFNNIFFVASTVAVVVIATVAFAVDVIFALCVCVIIVVANLMLMFSSLVLKSVPYFTVNNVGKRYEF